MNTVVVDTPAGRFRGLMRTHDQAFLGIRYALAPVAERRFCAPVPAPTVDGEYDATHLPPACPAPAGDADGPIVLPEEPMDEDCLFLSVYTPAADGKRRPVLFWIHGGAFIVGSSRLFDGGVWCREHDVVVVCVNYRLGPFGFLHLAHIDPTLEGSINNGLRDQICALRWVRDNIAAFGGDPQAVSIVGASAGAASVCALLACPQAEGLFRRAIAQSPGGPMPRLQPEAWAALSNMAIENLGGQANAKGLARLRSASPEELLAAVGLDFSNTEALANMPPPMLPGTVEGPQLGPAIDDCVVTRQPAAAIAEQGADAVPMILGNSRNEGTLLPQMLGVYEYNEAEAREVFAAAGLDPARAMTAYERVAPGSTPREKLVHALTEAVFRNYSHDLAAAMVKAGAPLWMYLLTWKTDHYDGKLGATHGLEFPFQWDVMVPGSYWAGFAGSDAPEALGPAIRALWASFLRGEAPNAVGVTPAWPRYDLAERPVLRLDRQLSILSDPDPELRELWGR